MLKVDYYNVLELKSDADDAAIKKAYRKLAIQWHPSSNTDNTNTELVQEKFRNIGEAYAVLSDAKRRTIYDQYGENGLKEGLTTARGCKIVPWSYNVNPEEQFSDFFGSVSPFAEFFGGDSGFVPLFPDADVKKAGKAAAQNINLYCSLEELYLGCTKKEKVTVQKLQLDGKSTEPEDVVMTVDVQAGWREGTKITFQCKGDEAAGCATGDVVFVLKEKPHPRFTRDKNELIYTATIDLTAALCGTVVEVQTLDRRTISIPITNIVKNNEAKVVPNEGMPVVGKSTRGNLLIKFDVQFPEMLSNAQKEKITEVLRS